MQRTLPGPPPWPSPDSSARFKRPWWPPWPSWRHCPTRSSGRRRSRRTATRSGRSESSRSGGCGSWLCTQVGASQMLGALVGARHGSESDPVCPCWPSLLLLLLHLLIIPFPVPVSFLPVPCFLRLRQAPAGLPEPRALRPTSLHLRPSVLSCRSRCRPLSPGGPGSGGPQPDVSLDGQGVRAAREVVQGPRALAGENLDMESFRRGLWGGESGKGSVKQCCGNGMRVRGAFLSPPDVLVPALTSSPSL